MNLPFNYQNISFARNNECINRVLPNPSNSNEILIFTSCRLETTFCYNIISNQYKTYTLKNWLLILLHEYRSLYPHLNLNADYRMSNNVPFDAAIGVCTDTVSIVGKYFDRVNDNTVIKFAFYVELSTKTWKLKKVNKINYCIFLDHCSCKYFVFDTCSRILAYENFIFIIASDLLTFGNALNVVSILDCTRCKLSLENKPPIVKQICLYSMRKCYAHGALLHVIPCEPDQHYLYNFEQQTNLQPRKMIKLLIFGGLWHFSQSFCEIQMDLSNYDRKECIQHSIDCNPQIQTAFAAANQNGELLDKDDPIAVSTFWYKSRYLICFGLSKIGTKNIVFYDSKTYQWHKCKYTMPLRVSLHRGIRMEKMVYFFGWAGYQHFKIPFGEDYLFQQIQRSWQVERLIWICYYKEKNLNQSKLQLNGPRKVIIHTFHALKNTMREQTTEDTINGYWIGKLPKSVVKHILTFCRVIPKLVFVQKS